MLKHKFLKKCEFGRLRGSEEGKIWELAACGVGPIHGGYHL